MKRVNLLAAGMFVLAQTLSGTAAAVTVAGSTVDFTFDDRVIGMFGPASVSGDTLFFTPTMFDVKSTGMDGVNLANESFNVRITAHAGYEFDSLDLLARGDYLLYGTGGMVAVGGQIRAFDLAAPQTDVTGSIAATAPLTTVGMPTRNWTATATADVSTLGARTLSVTIENLLLVSTSTPGSLAFIEKKYAGLTAGTLAITPVPEADTWAMMLAGLGLVGWSAMRRRRGGMTTSK